MKIMRPWADAYARARLLSALYGTRYRVAGVRVDDALTGVRYLYFVTHTMRGAR